MYAMKKILRCYSFTKGMVSKSEIHWLETCTQYMPGLINEHVGPFSVFEVEGLKTLCITTHGSVCQHKISL